MRALERKGWSLDRVTGSHHIFQHHDFAHPISVPMHRRDLPIGTLKSILTAAGISREELQELL